MDGLLKGGWREAGELGFRASSRANNKLWYTVKMLACLSIWLGFNLNLWFVHILFKKCIKIYSSTIH